MTGLDKILAQIKLQNEEVCKEIRNRADNEVSSIISDANKKAEAILKKGNTEAEEKSQNIIERAKSSAEIQKRSMLLSAKQECIANALEDACKYILSLPDKEYFDLVLSMIRNCSENKKGVLSFSEKDLGRLPSDFQNSVSDVSKGEISISQEPASIDGGFILSYGDIELNYSLMAIFSDNSERFSDEVSKILFS